MATNQLADDAPDLDYEADLCGNIEQALKALQGYGIMALELIQNADDACADILRIDARDDALVIQNTANFSRCSLTRKRCDWEQRSTDEYVGSRTCNFHAITRMGGRSKIGAQDQIGRFGIGFVSVYQMTDTPIIRSVGIEYTLNPREGSARRADIPKVEGTEFVLPWAFEQSLVRDAIHASVVPTDVADRVVAEISSILPASLLFLRNLKRVEVLRAGHLVMWADIERSDNGITLHLGPDGRTQNWVIQSREATDIVTTQRLMERFHGLRDLKRSTTVSIAIPIDFDIGDGLIYAYLPTKQVHGLPIHINADFFPHASRQDIVLEGESQERFWNEAMLITAASIVGERFQLLRDLLGPRKLWELGESSRILAGKNESLGAFWTAFSGSAKSVPSVWTIGDTWQLPAKVRSPHRDMGDDEQSSLASIGLSILHPTLRPSYNALHDAKVGVTPLKVGDVASALVTETAAITPNNPKLRALWSAIAGMLESGAGRTIPRPEVLGAPLFNVPFLLDTKGNAVTPRSGWSLPDEVPANLIQKILPDLPLVHSDALQHPRIASLVSRLDLDEYARLLTERIPDENAAAQIFGDTDEVIQTTYKLLTLLWKESAPPSAGTKLRNTPILRNSDGRFTAPNRAQMPGDFRDPTGYFDLVDTKPFPPGMDRFAEFVLQVPILSFGRYLEEHLEDALGRGVSRDAYQKLMVEIANHRYELGSTLSALKDISFVRNRAGQFVIPADCYFKDAALEAILGEDPARWVDPNWVPTNGNQGNILRDLFEAQLGMPTRVAAEHIVERVEQIADNATPEDAARTLTHVFRHLIERWTSLDESYREVLEGLSDIAFLPAYVGGEIDPENLYYPHEVFRTNRAAGFDSQVPIIGLTPLRATNRTVGEILDLIGVEPVPATSVVVDHLLDCIAHNRAPNDVTYAILSEYYNESKGLSDIDQLRGHPFIYDKSHGFLPATHVFWTDPPIGRHWHKVSRAMSDRQGLFTRLGVCIAPGPEHYAELALEIAGSERVPVDIAIHAKCLRFLAEALRDGMTGAQEAITSLTDEESLITLDGNAIWPADAFWVDSEQHLAPFGDDLHQMVVMPPVDCEAASARKLYAALGAEPLSEKVRLELAQDPCAIPDDLSTTVLRDRAEILVRLAPNLEARSVLRRILDGVTVMLAPDLVTRAELMAGEIPFRSEPAPADAFIDVEKSAVYIAAKQVGFQQWALIVRHLFNTITPLCPSSDLRSIAGTAHAVVNAPTLDDAEELVASFGFGALVDDYDYIPEGEELGVDALTTDTEDMSEGDAPYDNDLMADGEDAHQEAPNGLEADGNEASSLGGRDDHAVDPTGTAGALPGNSQVQQTSADEPYKSKPANGDLNRSGQTGNPSSVGTARGNGMSNGQKKGGDRSSRLDRTERRKRRSRLRSYVSSDDYSSDDRPDSGEASTEDRIDEIGAAAVSAVLAFEVANGRSPEEQDHLNPGFDIISRSPDGSKRLIEVKGIDGDWNEVGVKLSRRQFRFAQDNPDTFWLYVVEHALDLQRQRVRPMPNPFARVDEFYFDGEWRKACEVGASARDLMTKVGARVTDFRWGKGVVVKIDDRGAIKQATVKFDDFGLKLIPASKLEFLV